MLVSVNELVTYMDIRLSLRQQDAAELVLMGLQGEMEAYLGRPIEVTNFVEEYVIPSDYVGMPTSSFFYNTSLDTTMSPVNYSQPPSTIALRQSPVTKVNSVFVKNFSNSGLYMSEAMERTAAVTSAAQAGTNVTYTASNHGFKLGQKVSIVGATPSGYNISAKTITAVATNTFTVGGMTPGLPAYVSGGSATATGSDYVVRRWGIDLYRGFANDSVTVDYDAGLNGNEVAIFKLLILRAATREMQNMHDDVVGIKDLDTRNVGPLETGFTDRELMSIKSFKRVRVA